MEHIFKKGHRISQMTLGTVQLGMPYGINNSHGMPSEQQAHGILKTAEELGITPFHFDRHNPEQACADLRKVIYNE